MTEPVPAAFWRLLLPERAVTLTVPADRTLLQSLQQAGESWPASCRNGTCRTCMGQLESGRVRYAIDWPGLLPEERAGGAVLPCAAYPLSDITLRLSGA